MKKVIDELSNKLNNKKVLLACSTGVDSMVLLNLLEQSIPSSNIVVANVNHQKRSQSDIEEEYIKNYTKEKNIVCYTTKLTKHHTSNFQMWAREKRYEFFFDICKKESIDTILLAHHADDNIETIIARFLRSSSLEGYAGIKKEVKVNNITLYRPLIEIRKNKILEYAKINNIKYFDDDSNFTDDYERNRIRHNIIPILDKENPSLEIAIKNFSKTLFEANEFLEEYEISFIKNNIIVNNNDDEFFVKFDLETFLKEKEFLRRQILFRVLKPFKLSSSCLDETLRQITIPNKHIIKNINDKIMMIKEYGYVIITKIKEEFNYYKEIKEYGRYDLPNNTYIEVEKNIINFITPNTKLWYNNHCMPFIVRTRRPNDKILKNNKLISISNFLTNKKVPYLKRNEILLLCDKDSQPFAILGYVIK